MKHAHLNPFACFVTLSLFLLNLATWTQVMIHCTYIQSTFRNWQSIRISAKFTSSLGCPQLIYVYSCWPKCIVTQCNWAPSVGAVIMSVILMISHYIDHFTTSNIITAPSVINSGSTPCSHFTKVKDPLPIEKQANVIGKVYIGKTRHWLETPLKEHN